VTLKNKTLKKKTTKKKTTKNKAIGTRPVLIAVDGVNAGAVLAEARAALRSPSNGGISQWDASGLFQELAVGEAEAGMPSARTLLLLYAADLAFRLRWEIRPTLAEGRTVVAAPYVDTAMAFGRAAGLKAGWLENLFSFAPRAAERRFVHPRAARAPAVRDGFVAFSCDRIAAGREGRTRRQVIDETAAHLRRLER
jgi:hypothetical protein